MLAELLGERGLEHLAGDRGGDVAADAALDDEHGDRHLRRADGREGDEPGVRGHVRGPPISDVPVFPATVTPGMAALRPVPSLTTASIIVVTSPAILREHARTGSCGSRSTSGRRIRNGGLRVQPDPMVCATDAICSGVASTPPWPIPATPRSSGAVMSCAGRVTLSGTG